MRLHRLECHDFGSLRHLALDFDPHLTLIYGPNASGKSSVVDALLYVLTGLCRGTDRRGAGLEHVISEGGEGLKVTATISPADRRDRPMTVVRGVKGRTSTLLLDGALGPIAAQQAELCERLGASEAVLETLCQSRAFLKLGHADAKALLLQVLRVSVTVDGTTYTLPQLEAAYQQAFDERRAAKSVLSSLVVPPAPTEAAPDLAVLEAALAALEQELRERLVGAARDDGARVALERELAAAESDSALLDERLAAAPDGTAEIAALEAELAQLEPADGSETAAQQHRIALASADGRLPMLERTLQSIRTHDPKKGCVLDAGIPCKTAATHFAGQVTRLDQAIATLKADKDAATAALADLRRAVQERERRENQLAGLRRDQTGRAALLAQQTATRETRARLHDQIAALPPPATVDPAIAELEARIQRGTQTIREARALVDAWTTHQDATAKQQAHAKKVAALETRVEQLGPKGARVDALNAVVATFEGLINNALQRFGYSLQFVMDPWDVKVNGRSAVRLSESEALRVGVALQLALAEVTGVGLAIIDGADLLDGRNRSLLTQLLAESESQVIVTCTRDADPPAIDGLTVYWLALEQGATRAVRIGEAVAV